VTKLGRDEIKKIRIRWGRPWRADLPEVDDNAQDDTETKGLCTKY